MPDWRRSLNISRGRSWLLSPELGPESFRKTDLGSKEELFNLETEVEWASWEETEISWLKSLEPNHFQHPIYSPPFVSWSQLVISTVSSHRQSSSRPFLLQSKCLFLHIHSSVTSSVRDGRSPLCTAFNVSSLRRPITCHALSCSLAFSRNTRVCATTALCKYTRQSFRSDNQVTYSNICD